MSITLKRLQYFQVVVQKRQSKTASNRKASSKNGKTTGTPDSQLYKQVYGGNGII